MNFENDMDLPLQEAVDRVVKGLKLSSEYHEALCQSFESPNDREEFMRYAQGSQISFQTLPQEIKDKLSDYMARVQLVAETEILEKARNTPSRFNDQNDENRKSDLNMAIGSLASSPISRGLLPVSSAKVSHLHVYVNDTPGEGGSVAGQVIPWTVNLKSITEFLELLGTVDSWRSKAVIRGSEPASNLGKTCQLAGHLLLYGWNVFICTQGSLFKTESEAKTILKTLSRSGVGGIVLEVLARTRDTVSVDIVKLFCQYCQECALVFTVCYQPDDTLTSHQWLKQLFADADFNQTCPNLQILSQNQREYEPMSSRIEVWQFTPNSQKLIVGPQDQLTLSGEQSGVVSCRFSDKNWKDNVLGWFDESSKEHDVKI